jgi:hypothetical protein
VFHRKHWMVGCPSGHATTDGGSTRPSHNLFLHTDPDNDHSLSPPVSYRWSFYLFGQTILRLIKVMKIVKNFMVLNRYNMFV